MKTIPCEHRQVALIVVLASGVLANPVSPASAASMSLDDFDAIAARCAPSVPAQTLVAIARTESGVDPWVLHDNTTGTSLRPSTLSSAQRDAQHLVSSGDSVDIGLMQINSANLPALNISVADALDPCVSMTSGAAVLQAAYGVGSVSSNQDVALLLALSRYNTGTPFKGIMNGYARKVEQNGLLGATSPTAPTVPRPTDPNAPPAWNLWATAAYARNHGASWLVTSNADPGQP